MATKIYKNKTTAQLRAIAVTHFQQRSLREDNPELRELRAQMTNCLQRRRRARMQHEQPNLYKTRLRELHRHKV